jgi:cytochrome c551/c552
MDWGHDGSLYVGETNRGWGSAGDKNEGLQRVIWNGKTPFEMKTIKAMPDGFEIEFTKPADLKTLKDLANYDLSSFIYKYHPVYGSPPINTESLKMEGVLPSTDGMKVRIVVSNLRKYYVHKLYLQGVKDIEGNELLHPTGYYTLNNIPSGLSLDKKSLTTYNSSKTKPQTTTTKTTSKKTTATSTTKKSNLTYEDVKPLLIKHTCVACHNANKRQVGPSYAAIAKRNYTNEEIVKLIYKPNPKNWPDYATEMAPMPQVPRADALKIAEWINGLK